MRQVSKVVQKQGKVGGHDLGNRIEAICAGKSKPKQNRWCSLRSKAARELEGEQEGENKVETRKGRL